MPRIVKEGKVFDFVRFSTTGEGQWTQENVVCHVELQSELTQAARKQKIGEVFNFARNRPAPPKEERSIRVKGAKRARKAKTNRGKFGVRIKLGDWANLTM